MVYKSYYQWVPFVLFLQACLFYAPHALFKLSEGGKVKPKANLSRVTWLDLANWSTWWFWIRFPLFFSASISVPHFYKITIQRGFLNKRWQELVEIRSSNHKGSGKLLCQTPEHPQLLGVPDGLLWAALLPEHCGKHLPNGRFLGGRVQHVWPRGGILRQWGRPSRPGWSNDPRLSSHDQVHLQEVWTLWNNWGWQSRP